MLSTTCVVFREMLCSYAFLTCFNLETMSSCQKLKEKENHSIVMARKRKVLHIKWFTLYVYLERKDLQAMFPLGLVLTIFEFMRN